MVAKEGGEGQGVRVLGQTGGAYAVDLLSARGALMLAGPFRFVFCFSSFFFDDRSTI